MHAVLSLGNFDNVEWIFNILKMQKMCFICRMLFHLCLQVGYGNGLPEELPSSLEGDDSLQKTIHNILLQVSEPVVFKGLLGN